MPVRAIRRRREITSWTSPGLFGGAAWRGRGGPPAARRARRSSHLSPMLIFVRLFPRTRKGFLALGGEVSRVRPGWAGPESAGEVSDGSTGLVIDVLGELGRDETTCRLRPNELRL